MLQPRILVGSHRTDQHTIKLKSKQSVAIKRRCCKKTSTETTTTATNPAATVATAAAAQAKMWSHSERLRQVTANSDSNSADYNSDECGFITNRRRQTTHKSAQVWSPALNITSSIYNLATFLILAITLYSSTLCMAQLSEHNKDLQPTPSLDSNKQDITTILLVDNNNRAAHGRFLNVKPAVGLLTSTARTFIQDGVTTEYATQVLGKTIDNGRLYAQLLTKSSRVVYSNSNSVNTPNDIDTTIASTNVYNQIVPTQVIGIIKHFDEPSTTTTTTTVTSNDKTHADKNQTNLNNDDDNVVTFIKNTDYISPNNPSKSYTVQTVAVSASNAVNFASGEDVAFELLPQSMAQVRHVPLEEKAEVRQTFSVSESSSSSSSGNGGGGAAAKNVEIKAQVNPEKVQSSIELPTFTIPSGYQFEGIETNLFDNSDSTEIVEEKDSFAGSPQAVDIQANRVGKQLTSISIPIAGFTDDDKQLQSVTYYGFADFTTIVGNTVIVFSPMTAPPSTGKVTSIKGEATLHPQIKASQTVKQHHEIAQTKLVTLNSIEDSIRKSKAETTTTTESEPTTTTTTTTTESQESEETTKAVAEISTETAEEQSVEEIEHKSSVLANEQNSLKYNLSPSVIEASEVQSSTEEVVQTPSIHIVAASTASKTQPTMLSIPSDEDIKKILASLEAGKGPETTSSQEPVKAQTAETLTGATTIFIDDDPFALFSSTETETVENITPSTTVASQSTESFETTTENDVNVLTTTEEVHEPTTPPAIPVQTTTETNDSDEEEEEEEKRPETTTTSVGEVEELEEKPECGEGFELKPSTAFKTLTYLTTYFIPDEDNDKTSTSIEANDVIQTDVVFECSKTALPEVIKATSIQILDASTKLLENGPAVKISLKDKLFSRFKDTTTTPAPTTTTEEPSTENVSEIEQIDDDVMETNVTTEHVEGNTIEAVTSSFSSSSTTESTNDSEEDEIELIYKTLFTTYTYLTTFFHGYTSSVSSRKEVVTNIVTSTLDMSLIKSDAALADLVASMSPNQDQTERIEPTRTAGRALATQNTVQKEQPLSIEDVFDGSAVESNLNQATPVLSDSAIDASKVEGSIKTFYTTYTYYTTIFADGETEIASRTEVYTNFVGQSIKPSQLLEEDKIFATNVIEKPNEKLNEVDESEKEEQTTESIEDDLDNHVIQPSYSTMIRTSESPSTENLVTTQTSDDESNSPTTESSTEEVEDTTVIATKKFKKATKPSDSNRVVTNIRKQLNNILEDQISSESQNEEILPSSTLLLQTSFTTFTYFTTQYVGDSSQVLSRLETITNVVTETLQPTQTIVIAPPTLADELIPTTYFTTFTYWTTLFKEGEVVTTSNTQIVSNVVQPTATMAADEIIPATRVAQIENDPSIVIATPSIVEASTVDSEKEAEKKVENVVDASVVTSTPALNEPTTYFITYTYYTTSYIGDSSILKSRFETVTNVVTPTATEAVATVSPVGRAINLANANLNQIIDGKSDKKLAKERYVRPEVVSMNVGKIVDAEGISTIFYTTKAIGTYVNDIYTQTTEKASSVTVDEAKKSSVLAASPGYADNKHKTGLVRLIDGKIVANHTTTLYQSKVIGTIIDNRYAQIIESTSSYIIDKTKDPIISPTATVQSIRQTDTVITPTSAVVEGSISDSHTDEQHEDEEEDGGGDAEDEVDENGRKKSRLTFATKKRTFTPIIRPFASRNRPTFAPKRKNLVASSATIITRSDGFTPTITATPVGKAETSTRRFSGGGRRTSNAPHPPPSATSSPAFAGGSKRFSRLRSSSSSSSGSSSSSIAPSGSARIIRPSSIRPTQSSGALGSSRRVGNLFRSSALPGSRLSISPSQVRFRTNPTLTPSLRDSTTTKAPEQEESTTDAIENNPEETEADENREDEEAISTTTENARRSNNPLLRFRRPLTSSSNRFQPTTTPRASQSVAVTTRRSPLLGRARSTQTTTTTTTTARPKPRSFQKPAGLVALSNSRPRTSNNSLFPPRTLFKTTTEAPQEEINDVANESNNEEPINDEEATEIEEGSEDAIDPEYENVNRRENKVAFTPQSALRSRKRSKRQIEYGTRSASRYRRPTNQAQQISARASYDDIYYDEPEVQTPRQKTTNSRYQSRYRQESHEPVSVPSVRPNSQIRPTKTAAKQSRAQFTLRSGTEKDNYSPSNSRSSNFRRTQNISSNSNGYAPQTSARRKPLPTSSSRTKTSRLRNYGNTYQSDTRNGRGRTSTATNSRTSNRATTRARGRLAPDAIDYEYIPNFDGTITVTHQIPTETTIPIVNNGNTEYKNIITAKISTEILGPQQYSTAARAYNGNTLVLTSEATNINGKGATEITQFFLKEMPTTSVTFTPTQINRRKTSFSHIIPSTVYNVEQYVSTIQPQISADAPLANILLSQLLLGNLGSGLPQQQLLGLGGQLGNPLGGQLPFNQIQMTQATPVTEYKTRSSIYVTTLSNAKPTVLPITFRGKEILTTIYDDKVNVVTATEFVTDTIVTTPTQQIQIQPTQQFNNLLLQQLLAQQNQQQQLLQQQSPQPLNILNMNGDADKPLGIFQDTMLIAGNNAHETFNDKKNNKKLDADEPVEEEIRNDYPDLETYENNHDQKVEKRPPPFKSNNKPKNVAKPTPLKTSVITLYVSGRKPGEFSTVLSTVISTPDALLQKRAIDDQVIVKASKLPDFYDIYNAEGSNIDEIYMPAASTTNELNFIESSQNGVEYGVPAETQSLESILGDVSNYVTKSFLF